MTRWPPPPRLAPSFFKAHGLGNDYLVFEEGDGWSATPASVRSVCDRYMGVGSDGIVVLLAGGEDRVYPSRMFNPDGSEFERSGNGLRILASYIHRTRGRSAFVSVEMGRALTGAAAVELDPGAFGKDGRLAGPGGEALDVVPVSVGNPHLVVLVDEPTEALLEGLGPFLATHPALANGANVQLARPGSGSDVEALIWERGVGRTSASGTSACAVAVAAVARGLKPAGELTVRMPGGALSVTVSSQLDVVLRGPVEEVFTGSLTAAALEAIRGSDAGDVSRP